MICKEVDRHGSSPYRVMPHLRYLNALDGKVCRALAIQKERVQLHDIGGSGKTQSFTSRRKGRNFLPDGDQRLCYNEIATKQNWYYLRLDFDLATMRYLRFNRNAGSMTLRICPTSNRCVCQRWRTCGAC
ncbi:MAG: DUF6772 family protein [Caldilineaceae bacterium]